MESPLEYVPNPQFETWSRDKKIERAVLGPMPAESGPPGKVPPPTGVAPYMASLYETPLLTLRRRSTSFAR